jgi:pimeloyl-ACP methyl ester carboxylesterase
MATYVLIHGASSDSWYWHLVVPRLQAAGHDAVAPDLPLADPSKGWNDYADVVLQAIGESENLIVVGHSLGAFTAALVASRTPTTQLALVAAMVPKPGESAGAWWTNTGYESVENFDPLTSFFHDVPKSVTAEAFQRAEVQQSETPFVQPLPLESWPDVPTRFLLCRNDRFFPADFLRRVVADRLGIVPDEMDSGHLPALAHPDELADWLIALAGS